MGMCERTWAQGSGLAQRKADYCTGGDGCKEEGGGLQLAPVAAGSCRATAAPSCLWGEQQQQRGLRGREGGRRKTWGGGGGRKGKVFISKGYSDVA